MKQSGAVPATEKLFLPLWGLAAVGLAVALYWIFAVAPIEARSGVIQKIFYFHVPAALSMYAGFILCGIGSIVFLLRRQPRWDALAVSGAEVGLAFGGMVLLTGPLWAKGAWGRWWVWDDPQLTTTLLLVLVYTAYLFLRRFLGEQPGARRLPAVLAAIGMLDIPVIHYSVRLWRGQHPQVIRGGGGGLQAEMLQALLISLGAFLLLAALFTWLRYRMELASQRLDELHLDLLEREADRQTPTPRRAAAHPALASLLVGLLLVGGVLGGEVAEAQPAPGAADQAVAAPVAAPVEPAPAAALAAPAAAAPAAEPAPASASPAPAPAAPAPAAVAVPQPPVAPPVAVPVNLAGPDRRLIGGPLMLVAYGLIWGVALLLLLLLWRKQQKIDKEIEELQRKLGGNPS